MPLKPIILKGEQKRVLFLQVQDPIQIKGVAGSGKTTVALYRAKHLIDTQGNLFQEAEVAIFTYNKTLVKYIKAIMPQISGGYNIDTEEIKPKKPIGLNVFITNFHSWAFKFLKSHGEDLSGRIIQDNIATMFINQAKTEHNKIGNNITSKTPQFLLEEVSWIKGKAFELKEEYLDAKRSGRGTNDRVTKLDKEGIWDIYTKYITKLKERKLVDYDDYALLCLFHIKRNPSLKKPYTHIIIDEAQDLNKAQILVLSKIVSEDTKSLTIIADAAQRIYKSGFTWSEVGLNVRGGRTIEFKKNYRNTTQIAEVAISLLEKEKDNSEFTEIETSRRGETKPIIGYFQNSKEQSKYILNILQVLRDDNTLSSTVILHRDLKGLQNVKALLNENGFENQDLLKAEDIDYESESVKLCTLSSVKGLEFENVIIIDLNDNIIPYPHGFNDLEDDFQISTERRLLYTSITRARERLFLLSSGIPSRYLSEINEELVEIITNPVYIKLI